MRLISSTYFWHTPLWITNSYKVVLKLQIVRKFGQQVDAKSGTTSDVFSQNGSIKVWGGRPIKKRRKVLGILCLIKVNVKCCICMHFLILPQLFSDSYIDILYQEISTWPLWLSQYIQLWVNTSYGKHNVMYVLTTYYKVITLTFIQ